MPLYDYECKVCDWKGERQSRIANRDHQWCNNCNAKLTRKVAAPLARMAGVVPQGGGPDRFTADLLGIPLKELPQGLRS